MRQRRRCLLLFQGLALAGVITLAGCGSKPELESGPASPVPVDNSSVQPLQGQLASLTSSWQRLGLPALPGDKPASAEEIRARRVSAAGEIGLFGSQAALFDQGTARIDMDARSCELDPGPGQLSWAMYAFPGLSPEDLPLTLSLHPLGELPPSTCYVASSNYTKGRWDWTVLGPGQDAAFMPLGAGAGTLSPGGNLYVVVATYDAVPFGVGELRLLLDCPDPPPCGFVADPGDGVNTPVHLSWSDPALSFDPDGDGPEQFVYDGVLVRGAQQPDGPWQDLAQLPPGTTSYDDPGSLGGNPPPDGGFYYHLMTLVSGATPLAGVSVFGEVNLAVNQLVARFTPQAAAGSPGMLVSFSASSSTLTGGTLSSAKWDFDGDGKTDFTSATGLTASHYYMDEGRFYPRLLLTMDIGGGSKLTDKVTGFVAVGDQRGDWSQGGRNGQHTGCSPFRGPTTSHIRGSYDAGTKLLSPSIGADGKVYITSADGRLLVFDPDCTLDSEVELGGVGSSPPAIDSSGYIWLNVNVTGLNKLICVFPDFSVHTFPPYNLTGNPLESDDGLYVIAPEGEQIYKAKPVPAPGDKFWYHWRQISLGSRFSDLALRRDGYAIGVEADTFSSQVVDLMTYYLYITFQYFPKDMGPRVPMVSNSGYIYVPTGAFPYYQIRVYPGSGYFEMGVTNWTEGPPAATSDGRIYATTTAGAVFGFDSPSGAVHTPFATYALPGARFASPPVIDADGRVYALTIGGKVICLTRKLAPVWSYDLGATAVNCQLAIGNDGTLYVGGTDKLLAFK